VVANAAISEIQQDPLQGRIHSVPLGGDDFSNIW